MLWSLHSTLGEVLLCNVKWRVMSLHFFDGDLGYVCPVQGSVIRVLCSLSKDADD